MKISFTIIAFLLFSINTLGQTKFELYKSALNSATLNQVSETQSKQIEAQLIKNEELDAGLNFYYLIGNFPVNQKIREEYNAQRVIRALTNNNYLLQLESKLKDSGVSNYIITTFISGELGNFTISDINKNYINLKVSTPDSLKNIQYYYRLLQIDKSYMKNFENEINYLDLWENRIHILIKTVLGYSENLTLENEENVPADIFKNLIRTQSLVNGLGNDQLLIEVEKSSIKLLLAYDELIKKYGKGMVKNGNFAFLDIFSGFKFNVGYNYIFGMEQEERFPVEKNEFTSAFEVNQHFNSNQFISMDFGLSAFYLFPRKSLFSKSRITFSIGISNPLNSAFTENRLNDYDKYTYYDQPQFKSVSYKDLYTKSNNVPLKVFTAYGFTLPVYEISTLGSVETGAQFISSIYSSESKFNYFVQIDAEDRESGEKYRIITNHETKTFSTTKRFNEFNLFVKFRSDSFVGFQNEILIGNAFSYIQLCYEY